MLTIPEHLSSPPVITICVGHNNAQANTNNVNKTAALIEAIGGKDEPNIDYMWKSSRTSQHETQNVKTHNRTTQKTKKKTNNTDTTK
jgi:hypothetical protein